MNHAIKTLENELKRLNTPTEEDEDLIDAVINFRATTDIKLALKILNQFIENSKVYDNI